MPLDFPTSPTVGQTYTSGTKTWQWDGSAWVSVNSAATTNPTTTVLLYAGM